MICVSVFYANIAGKNFDNDYYAHKHLPMVLDRLKNFGMSRYEFDRGISGAAPGMPAPYIAIGRLYLDNLEGLQMGMAHHRAEIVADVRNYTDIEPDIQISELD